MDGRVMNLINVFFSSPSPSTSLKIISLSNSRNYQNSTYIYIYTKINHIYTLKVLLMFLSILKSIYDTINIFLKIRELSYLTYYTKHHMYLLGEEALLLLISACILFFFVMFLTFLSQMK